MRKGWWRLRCLVFAGFRRNNSFMPAEVVRIYESTNYDAAITRASDILRTGGVVVLPTETVYGAAAALNRADGLNRLREIRGQQNGTFTIHMARMEDAIPFIGEVSDYVRRVMGKLWPGPVALQFDVTRKARNGTQRHGVNEADLYADGRITLRYPSDIVAVDTLARVGSPVVFTRHGHISSVHRRSYAFRDCR